MLDTPKNRALANQELDMVKSQQNTILPEEFPDGPYGSRLAPDHPTGKSSPWQPGQQVASRFQDENPVFTDDLASPKNAELPDL